MSYYVKGYVVTDRHSLMDGLNVMRSDETGKR